MQGQIKLELALAAEGVGAGQADPRRAFEIAAGFSAALPTIRALADSDARAGFEGDPSAASIDEVIFSFPGFAAVLRHRLAHQLYRLGAPMLARIASEDAHGRTGIDIHPGAEIGERFFIDHGTGVVIGETAIIGRNVRLYQSVTLGAKRFETDETGALRKNYPRHPIVEDDVVIYAGATILGRVTIGRGSSIGGGVWLTHDVAAQQPHRSGQAAPGVFRRRRGHIGGAYERDRQLRHVGLGSDRRLCEGAQSRPRRGPAERGLRAPARRHGLPAARLLSLERALSGMLNRMNATVRTFAPRRARLSLFVKRCGSSRAASPSSRTATANIARD